MTIEPGGNFVYQNEPELMYNMLNAMGLSTTPDGTIIDTDIGGAVIQVSGKSVKATINGNDIKYAGDGEIVLEPLTNSRLLVTFFSRALDKYVEENEKPVISYFPEESVDQDGNKINRFGIHWLDQSTYYTSFYYNRCLAVIEAIFFLGEIPVNLHNFDSLDFVKD